MAKSANKCTVILISYTYGISTYYGTNHLLALYVYMNIIIHRVECLNEITTIQKFSQGKYT